MRSAVSAISLLIGGAVAYIGERIPARAEALETCAGVLLIGAFAVLGSTLPVLL